MMNGAAMNCHRDRVLGSQHSDSQEFRGAGYGLQLSRPCEQNYLPKHSKAQSDQYLYDGSSQYLQRVTNPDMVDDPRFCLGRIKKKEIIDLPVPTFVIDENCVANNPIMTTQTARTEPTNLDLDTRINLLIKSKALAGLNPIFSELIESDDDSEELPNTESKYDGKIDLVFPPDYDTLENEKCADDPTKPLSRPPSPFLSRAKYLFCFNKAFEIKEQAKAQEQALLKMATENFKQKAVSNKIIEKSSNNEHKTVYNGVLNEIGTKMRESIKQQFLKELIDNTISNAIDRLWGSEEGNNNSNGIMMETDSVSEIQNTSNQVKSKEKTLMRVKTPIKKKSINCTQQKGLIQVDERLKDIKKVKLKAKKHQNGIKINKSTISRTSSVMSKSSSNSVKLSSLCNEFNNNKLKSDSEKTNDGMEAGCETRANTLSTDLVPLQNDDDKQEEGTENILNTCHNYQESSIVKPNQNDSEPALSSQLDNTSIIANERSNNKSEELDVGNRVVNKLLVSQDSDVQNEGIATCLQETENLPKREIIDNVEVLVSSSGDSVLDRPCQQDSQQYEHCSSNKIS